jgi:ABC-2 type transport system permease protein
MLLCVLVSNVLMALVVLHWLGDRIFYAGWLAASGGASRDRVGSKPFLFLDKTLRVLPRDVGAIAAKDIRTFFRDPMQWSQAAIFFGLLGLYFSSLRSFRYDLLTPEWRNLVAFLNVFSVSAVLCSLASRFVYPQLSLEGQGLWILGLSPTNMTRVLITKFLLALLCILAVSTGLIYLSSTMLSVSPLVRWVAVSVAAAMAVAVSALSIGLGAAFIDLEQQNPAAIVSGFGGTLNLVLSLIFMLGAIFPFGFLFHAQFINRIAAAQFHSGLLAAGLWLLLLTAAFTLVPLWIGSRRLRALEY